MAKTNLAKPAKRRKFPVWLLIIAILVCVCVAVAFLWQPVTTALFPEATLTVAVANTVAQAVQRLSSPLASCIDQCVSYVYDGSMDVTFTLDSILADTSYRLTSASDPVNRRQASSYHITVLGLGTEMYTYLDGDCAAFSMNMVTGGSYYGITFDTYASDLENAPFYGNLNPETIQSLNSWVAELDAVYPGSSKARSGNALALPDIEAPDWLRMLLAYAEELEFEGSETVFTLDGVSRKCSAIQTTMDGRYAANMFLDALETVSSNIVFASSLYNDDEAEDTPELQEKLEYYRDQTEGTVTLVAYVYKNALVGLDLEWVFTENNGSMAVCDVRTLSLNLGANPSESLWLLTLKETGDSGSVSTEYSFGCDELTGSSYYLTQERTENGVTATSNLTLNWDDATGALEARLTKITGASETTATATGSLHRSDAGVTLELNGLYSIFKLSTLPDFLQGADLGLVQDITVSAAFSPDVDITKPEYINLDQWDLPFLLDLFL